VDLDCALDDELVRGGYAREIVNRIQQRRKEMGLNVSDRIEVAYEGDAEVERAATEHAAYVAEATLAVALKRQPVKGGVKTEIDGRSFAFRVVKA
jgi:isoleucyl-tRNA synthetase